MSAVRRIRSLAGAEALLLRRNPMALLTGVLTPVGLTLAVRAAPPAGQTVVIGTSLATGLAGFAMLALVYYNLVTILVARREELMLKRLRTGECTDAEILAGAAVPSALLAWGQIALAIGVFALRWPANIVVLLLGLVLGTLVFGLLAALSTTVTRTVEMAQVTTLPVLAVSSIFAVPGAIGGLPPVLTDVGQWLPMSRVVELVHQGLTGAGSLSDVLAPVLVLCAWVAVAGWATRRWFRWEPRR
jgi:ABC-2 type transport system permease protein